MKHLARHPLRAAVAVAFMAGTPLCAWAGQGPYVGIEGGMNWMTPQGLSDNGEKLGALHLKPGWVGGLNFGYATTMGFRPEIELDWRNNEVKRFTSNIGGGAASLSGREQASSVFGNLWYDIKTDSGFFSVVHPYFGGGVGGMRVALRHINAAGGGLGNSYDTVLAYQGGAGLGFDLNYHLTASLDYRWVFSNRGAFYNNGAAGAALGAAVPGPVDARYRANTAMLSVRYAFGEPPPPPVAAPPPPPPPPPVVEAPPPPPPPPPPPAPVCNPPAGFKVDANCHIIEQTIVVRAVDFEFNQATLTGPARETLDQVASALAAQPGLNVEVDGYTDNVGKAAYNLKLSQKRSQSVVDYLSSKGVDRSRLTAHGYGKANPIASNDTEEGRAQNRRVEFKVSNPPPSVKVQSENASAASQSAAQTEAIHRGKATTHKKHHHKKAVKSSAAPADDTSATPAQ